MRGIAWIKDFGRRVYLTFKVRRIILISIVLLSIPSNLLYFLPSTMRLVYLSIYVILMEIMVFIVVRFFTGSVTQVISGIFYNRKHKPQEWFYPKVKQMARRIGMSGYNKPIYITDNPTLESPFVNAVTGKITVPSSFMAKFHSTEIDGGIGHELAHIKYCRRLFMELSWATIASYGFSLMLAAFTSPTLYLLYLTAEVALMMLLFSYVLQRNEYRADSGGAEAATPEALISIFQYFKYKYGKDEGSETHPSLQSRIERLLPLLEKSQENSSDES
jgi:Zn-dependent protease with chaperone function